MLYLILYLMGAAVAYYVICAVHNYTPILDDSPQTFRHVLIGAVVWPITLVNYLAETNRGMRWKTLAFRFVSDTTDFVFSWVVKGHRFLTRLYKKTYRL
jgi:hypothetical protein